MARYQSRKWQLTLLSLIILTVMVAVGKLTGGEFTTALGWVLALYFGANVVAPALGSFAPGAAAKGASNEQATGGIRSITS
jgi:uncharacterized protein (DUF58 family)